MENTPLKAKLKLNPPDGNVLEGLPEYRSFVTIREFAKYVGQRTKTVRAQIRKGQIKTEPHPTRNEKVIPFREIRRILMVDVGAPIPYDGRKYPHQFFLFFLLACVGKDFDTVRADLMRYKLMVPPEHELKGMLDSLMITAPRVVRNRIGKNRDHTRSRDFREWMGYLQFNELYEDLYGYVPHAVMGNLRLRFMIEIMGTANFTTGEAALAILRVDDTKIEATVIQNYVMMFHYIRGMSNNDWSTFLHDVADYDSLESVVRGRCVDHKVNVYKEMGLDGQIRFKDIYRDTLIKTKWAYDRMLESEDFADLNMSVTQIRGMKMVADILRQDAQSENDRRQPSVYPNVGGAEEGAVGGAEDKSAEDNDLTFEELHPESDAGASDGAKETA